MKKISEFFKSAGLISRIFIILWAVLCILITLGFLADISAENFISDFIILIFSYLFFSAMLLVPAGTIAQAQQIKANSLTPSYSTKSYWATLLLVFFLGLVGAHRFYVGRKKTGILYLFTMGGGTIGWLVDIILVLIGMFPDKDGQLVHLSSSNKTETTGKKSDHMDCSTQTDDMQRNVDANKATNSTLFSDIIVAGEEEKKQAIPTNLSSPDQDISTISSAEFSSLNTQESVDYHPSFYSVHPNPTFIAQMKQYANLVGKKADFVPFMQYWPTYDNMDEAQRAWYFYWRTQVRNGQYPDTDLSYIFVYIYELLSGIGWKEAEDGYNQLTTLWTSYRERFPRLDDYLGSWVLDFINLHQLDLSSLDLSDYPLPNQSPLVDLLIDRHCDEKPLKLSFPFICYLCDYSITSSKFYKDGHQVLIQQAIPRVVALADAALLKEKGRGLLKSYGPNRPKKQVYTIFRSAVCPDANRQITLSVKAYTTNKRLRNYVTQLVRFSENVLRSIYHYRGRLRGVELDAGLASLTEHFLHKEYSLQKEQEKDSVKKAALQLNFETIADLRVQSDAVRDALEVEEDVAPKELLTELTEITAIYTALSDHARQLLWSLKATDWEGPIRSEETDLVEEINAAATRFIARALIVVENGRYIVEDDYRDELYYLYENSPSPITPSTQQTTPLHDIPNASVDADQLTDPFTQFVAALSQTHKQVLHAILFLENPQEKIAELADQQMSMPEILIDEINDIATQFLDDILIDTQDDTPVVLEQYADDLKRAVQTLGVE